MILVMIGNLILGIHGMFGLFFLFFYLSAVSGVACGLFVSAFSRTTESAVNWIPLILIPQIILGGVLIMYEDMNRNLFLDAKGFIPEFCQLIPSRWSHEALTTALAHYNPRDIMLRNSSKSIKSISRQIKQLKKTDPIDGKILVALKQRRQRLRDEKGTVETIFPNENYRNISTEDIVIDADGDYFDMKSTYPLNDIPTVFPFLKIQKLHQSDDSQVSLNAPFCSVYKGVMFKNRYYEIDTVLFDTIILMTMIAVLIALCMVMLKMKKN